MKWWKIYTPFAVNELKRQLAYRVSAIGWMLVNMVVPFFMYFLWKAIFQSAGTETLGGFTFLEMAVYVCVCSAANMLGGSSAAWVIGREVVQGTISMSLIKPINYSARIYFQDLGGKAFRMVSAVIPLLLIVYLVFGWTFDPLRLMQFILSIFLSTFIYFFFYSCYAMLAFYTTYIWGLTMALYALIDFLSGAVIPIAFFPAGVRTAFQFLPFQYLTYTPVMTFLGKYTNREFWTVIGIQLVWIVILYALSKFLWARAIKRLTILGG